jgi:hypothetical protein
VLEIITPLLGMDEFAQLRADGRGLTEDQASALAFPTTA